MRGLPFAIALLVLGACTLGPAPMIPPNPGPGGPGPSPGTPQDSCGASAYQHLVGGPLPRPFPAPGGARIIPHGMNVTLEYVPTRLNVDTDSEARRVLRIWCG